MRKNWNGLLMLAGSLVVIVSALALVTEHEASLRREQLRARGLALVNSLSRIPLAQLATTERHLGPLSIIQASQGPKDFAYAIVSSVEGETLDVVSQVGVVPAATPLKSDATSWSGQRILAAPDGEGSIREFCAPVLEGGQLVAQVRVAYREPTQFDALIGSTFYAGLALLIFMAFPIAYVWLRREIAPLKEIVRTLPDAPGDVPDRRVANRSPSETIDAVAIRVRAFCEEMEARSESMGRERMALLASSKVASHERSRFQQLLDAVPDAVLALSSEGRVTVVNPRAAALFKKAPEELMGATPAEWCGVPELVRLIGRHSGSQSPLLRPEVLDFALDELGNRRMQAQLHPLPTTDGMAIVIRDVTAEFVARETQAEFLGHMAHELKAPLNVISMYAETLLEPDGEEEGFRIESCNIIRDEVDRLNGLINNIFSIGRIESGNVSVNRQRIRTREFLADVFESTARSSADLNLDFQLELPEPMGPIFGDKQLLSVALKNLMTNAAKYNKPGGRVLLAAEEQEAGLLIRVADTGIGIPEDDLEQVFEKFYRSEDDSVAKVTGHGLGLALVKEIVALHGGEIRVQSTLGEGSEFSFFFGRNCALFQEEG